MTLRTETDGDRPGQREQTVTLRTEVRAIDRGHKGTEDDKEDRKEQGRQKRAVTDQDKRNRRYAG